MHKQFYIYILARRVTEHKQHIQKGFTEKYNVTRLAYVEYHDTFASAVTRENQLKTWQRKWKLRIIEEQNPAWKDLTESADNVC